VHVTQRTIAQAAGVSATAVSFVLTGRAAQMKLSAQTVQKVRQAAKRLGFTGNYHARSLALGRSHTLGLGVPGNPQSLLSHFWAPVVVGAGSYARQRGYNLLFLGDRADMGAEQGAAQALREGRIDGAILLPFGPADAACWPDGAAVVGIGDRKWKCPSVALDAGAGVMRALEHLEALGHREVLYLGRRSQRGLDQEDRVRAFRVGVGKLALIGHEHFIHLDVTEDHPVEWFIAYYREAITANLHLPRTATAVVCYNDDVGLALCSVLAERGVKVPADVSVMGFDDMHAACAIPPLTTISHMLPELGARAVNLVLTLAEAKRAPRGRRAMIERVPARLVVRASTGPPPCLTSRIAGLLRGDRAPAFPAARTTKE